MKKSIIYRYLAASFTLPFIVSLVSAVGLLLTLQIFKVVELVINKGVSPLLMLTLFSHMAVSTLTMAIPLSTIFATLFVLNKLSGDSEIIAMKSFGLSKYQLLAPFLIIGCLLGLAVFSLQRGIIPKSTAFVKNALVNLAAKGLLTEIKKKNFLTTIPRATIFTESVSEDSKHLTNVFIHLLEGNEGDEKIIFAQKGQIISENVNEWGHADLKMKLFDGTITETNGHQLPTIENPGTLAKINFREYIFPLSEKIGQMSSATKETMRSGRELAQILALSKEKQLNLGLSERDITMLKIESWNRLLSPFQSLLFVFLGVALGVRKTRGAPAKTGPMALIILVSYYSFYFAGLSLARKADLMIPFILSFPLVIGFAIGLVNFRRMDWQG